MGDSMSTKLKAGTASSGAVLDADTTGILELQSGSTPTTAITVDASQNVGIGTSSPAHRLNVATTSGNAYIRVERASQTTGQTGLQIGGGTSSTDWLFYMPASSNDLAFFGNSAERMRIDTSGSLLVGTSTNTTNGGFIFSPNFYGTGRSTQVIGHINGASSGDAYIVFNYNGTGIGSITQNGTTATAYNTSSDYRLKENIAPMTGALATVSQLKPVTYKWKADGSSGQGFIAHELQAVVPDCVTGEKDSVDADGNPIYQGIDTSFLVATLTKAIQELNAKVDAQAVEIATLKGNA